MSVSRGIPNDRLRQAVFEARMTPEQLARKVEVNPKTVERWITQGRIPYPVHQFAVAVAIGVSEKELWPNNFEQSRYLRAAPPPRESSERQQPAIEATAVSASTSEPSEARDESRLPARIRELMSWVDATSPLKERDIHAGRVSYSRGRGVERSR